MYNIPDVMCSTCIHFDECTYKDAYLSFLVNTINDFDFIRDVKARCILYHCSGMNSSTSINWDNTIYEYIRCSEKQLKNIKI